MHSYSNSLGSCNRLVIAFDGLPDVETAMLPFAQVKTPILLLALICRGRQLLTIYQRPTFSVYLTLPYGLGNLGVMMQF